MKNVLYSLCNVKKLIASRNELNKKLHETNQDLLLYNNNRQLSLSIRDDTDHTNEIND